MTMMVTFVGNYDKYDDNEYDDDEEEEDKYHD